MNEMSCMKQGRNRALWFCGDLIQLMAETSQGFIPTCQCQEAPNVPSVWPEQKWAKRVDRTLLSRSNFLVFLTIS